MMYKIVSIITFSLLLISCQTFSGNKVDWPLPEKPIARKVHFSQVDNGLILSTKDASNLNYNLIETRAYTEKLEVLVKAMKKHYEK